ncbi:MAG: hypothetical protein WCO26_13875 [Deltaproteobacteria bacterium]
MSHNNDPRNTRKGTIQKGSDADLVLFDPNQAITLQPENQHSGARYTLYEGRTCPGRPVFTMQRGRILIEPTSPLPIKTTSP